MQKEMLGEMIEWDDMINQGLVLYYRFNEGMGSVVRDLSLNDNHGTLKNMTHPGTPSSGWTPGFRGKTIAFDGVDNYIDCGNAEILNFDNETTIAVWMKTSATANNQLYTWDLSSLRPSISVPYSSSRSIIFLGSSNYRYFKNSPTDILDGEYHHVVFILTGSSQSDITNSKMYADGREQEIYSTVSTGATESFSSVAIGKSSTEFFDGSIDEVRIYNRALTQSEVFKLALEGMPSKSTTHAYPNYFVFDCATTGATETFALPLEATGTYDFEVHWGDGSWDIITAHDDAAATHTYASAGTHQIVIDGHIEGFRFNNGGDKLKIRDIKSWGCLQLGNSTGYFWGCTDLTVSATDILNLSGTTNLYTMFTNCDAITTIPSINSWDMSSVTNINNMFSSSLLFNQDISNWDVSSVADMTSVFYACPAFNQDLRDWDTSSVTIMNTMFKNATAFDQDIGSWDITSMTDATQMFNGVTLSTANYDALLVGWEGQVEQPNVVFHAGNSKYSAGAAATARAALVANGWNISDGGQA